MNARRWSSLNENSQLDDHEKGTNREIERSDHDRRPRAGRGLCSPDLLAERGSGLGIGSRAKRTTPAGERMLAVLGHIRWLLHVHVLESRADQGRLEGLL